MERNVIKHRVFPTPSLDTILSYLPEYIYWKDCDFVYQGCNEQLAKAAGLSSTQNIVGMTDKDFGWSDARIQQLNEEDARVINTGNAVIVEEEFPLPKDGSVRIMLTHKSPLLDKHSGKIIGIVGVSVDITDKKKAERLEKEKRIAEETAAQLKALSGSIAHQLTTPVSCIGLSAEFLEGRFWQLINNYKMAVRAGFASPGLSLEDIREVEDELQLIHKGVEKASYIIEHHLMNIKSSHKHFMLDLASLRQYSMSKIVQEALSDYPFIENQAGLVHWLGGEDFRVMADKGVLLHVLYNLIDNALESLRYALKKDGKITIWLERDKNGDNCLHIKDNGLGLSREGRVHLFKPFKTTRENGTGLGLYFCKIVMQAHRGDIISRGSLGKYAQFILKFPPPGEFNRYLEKDYDRLFAE